MAKARTGDDKPSDRAKASAPSAAKVPGRASGGTRRQFRQIARLVARLEAAGDLEARSRRQLEAALEKGRKSRRPRQEVDRAVARVAKLIERLRLLARELETPVPPAPQPAAAPKPAATKPAATPKATSAAASMPRSARSATTAASRGRAKATAAPKQPRAAKASGPAKAP